MIYLYVHHKVKDYDQWKKYFDSDENERLKSGIELKKIFRSVKDSNHVHILLEAPKQEEINKFFRNPRLKEIMQKAGVISEPEIYMLELA